MKTIIIYSTKYGSVRKVAEKLKDHLEGQVDLSNVKSAPPIDDYDAVILGGSIYAFHIQKEMRKYVKSHLERLKQKKPGLYICARNDKETSAAIYLKNAYTKELCEHAVAKANLGYEIDLQRFSFFDRLISRIVGVKESESVFYEERIRDFAAKIQDGGNQDIV